MEFPEKEYKCRIFVCVCYFKANSQQTMGMSSIKNFSSSATPHFNFRVRLLCEKRNCVMVYLCGEIRSSGVWNERNT
jgi:hypothetical protein